MSEIKDPAVNTPPGIPGDYTEYVQTMYDIVLLAFQSDSTRVATLLLAHDGSNRSFDHIGISEGHHDLTHHQNRADWIAKVADIDRWYAKQFAKLLGYLKAIPETDGKTVLDHTIVLWCGEFGRTPFVQGDVTKPNAHGRDHLGSAYSLWIAGGGFKGGTVYGETDEYCSRSSALRANL